MNSCLICHGAVRPLTDALLKQTAWRCQACHAVFKATSDRPTKTAEKARYDTHQNSPLNEGYVAFLTRFIDDAISPFIAHGRALDYGCGPGPVLGSLLQERGFEVSLYDPFYYPDTAVLHTTYDLITSTEVLEHLFDPHATFEVIAKALKPGGILSLMTHFVPQSDEAYLQWWYRRDETHVVFYHQDSLTILATRYGLSVVGCDETKMMTLRKVSQ